MRPRHRRLRDALYAEEYSPALIAHLAGCRSCQRLAGRLATIERFARSIPIPELSLKSKAMILGSLGHSRYKRWAEEGGAQPTPPSA